MRASPGSRTPAARTGAAIRRPRVGGLDEPADPALDLLDQVLEPLHLPCVPLQRGGGVLVAAGQAAEGERALPHPLAQRVAGLAEPADGVGARDQRVGLPRISSARSCSSPASRRITVVSPYMAPSRESSCGQGARASSGRETWRAAACGHRRERPQDGGTSIGREPMKHTRSVRRAIAALVAAGLVAVPLSVTGAADAKPTRPPGKPVTVMTRTCTSARTSTVRWSPPPTAQAQGRTPRRGAGRAGQRDVRDPRERRRDRLRHPGRAARHEIAASEPDLVGLQEVAWWRHGPLDLGQVGDADATTTDYDFLPTLLDSWSPAGREYVPVSIAPARTSRRRASPATRSPGRWAPTPATCA